jgi:hypothetical protein
MLVLYRTIDGKQWLLLGLHRLLPPLQRRILVIASDAWKVWVDASKASKDIRNEASLVDANLLKAVIRLKRIYNF